MRKHTHPTDESQPEPPEPDKQKKSYETPTLRKLGGLRQLTEGTHVAAQPDDGSASI